MDHFIFDGEGRLNCFYYGSDQSIYHRIYDAGKWSRAVCVISEARRHFSVTDGNSLDIICQETGGDIILCKKNGDGWENRVILESRGINPPDMRMQRLGNSVIYNMPEGREQTLVLQHRADDKWERSEPIDTFAPFADGLYRIIGLPDKRKLLIYRKNIPKQRLYFRISNKNGSFGDYKTVYSTNNVITDCSAVFYKGFLHFVLVVRGRFSSGLIYIRAAEQAAERRSTVLWEGNRAGCTAIMAENDTLVVTQGTAGRLHTFISSDTGFKGSDVRYSGGEMRKAYVTGSKDARCCEIIVPADKPYNIDTSLLV